tara:strand:+ start:611 stop:814 length:204 start_codon:yes stop_codon:yes gene_type:complete
LLIKNPKHPVLQKIFFQIAGCARKYFLERLKHSGKYFNFITAFLDGKIFFQKTPEFRPKKKTPLAHI